MGAQPLFSDEFLHSRWAHDFDAYLSSGDDAALLERLKNWVARSATQKERQLEGVFSSVFFEDVWGYWGTGRRDDAVSGYCLFPQYPVPGAGQGGGQGQADLALGWWSRPNTPETVQVLCEFKDIRSSLDAPQNRKGNNRSPVSQCLDYLKHSFADAPVNLTPKPTWAIATDMNEFRLYHRKYGETRYQRYVLKSADAEIASLIDDAEDAAFQRFLFQRLFSRELLIASAGTSPLQQLLDGNSELELALEKEFYREYQAYRESVYRAIVDANPSFHGTRGTLVRLTQRLLDRCIFILFCEDMGQALDFPPELLRDMLIAKSLDHYFEPEGDQVWSSLKTLFRTMRDGGPFPPNHRIGKFNGGLFEELVELESLRIPNRVFCKGGQGVSPESIRADKGTLLYLAAQYNFGARKSGHERTISLYTLGRIFEQSITELEYMEAEADGKESIASLTKRKRDGVYYTPEGVTGYIVEQVVGERLRDIRDALDLEIPAELPETDMEKYRSAVHGQKKRIPDNAVSRHMRLLDEYENAVARVKVLDPACGSGAFLIQALDLLLAERQTIAEERARVKGIGTLFDPDASTRDILASNLYGVDINPESVEITQLSLWLKTASPGKPLSNLQAHIRWGNSLVDSGFADFYSDKHSTLFEDAKAQAQEDVRVFDWESEFPDVLGLDVPAEQRGFDCVVGNPPYVKLQHFRKLKPDESDYYVQGRRRDGAPVYESAQTGNFDLYLLFIEKGLALLGQDGRMGYIAPSLWLKSEYGLGLRRLVKRGSSLDRWIDFGSHQVFAEAATYTALQFFRGRPSSAVRFSLAPDGDIASIDWEAGVESVAWDALPADCAWNLAAAEDAALIARLAATCKPLSESCAGITVGIQTSADIIYHLKRIAPGRYSQQGSRADGVEHQVEDAVMHPLVSGREAKRYQLPTTETYILFPYTTEAGTSRLFTAEEMRVRFPRAWSYLRGYEAILRARECHKMDNDDVWWGYNYPKNLDKQEFAKLLVPRLVTRLFCVADEAGEFYLDNVDVGGVIPSTAGDLWFLCGVLNGPVCDFMFRRISKPFRGDTLSANKQYIAPLPIPRATEAQKAWVAALAKRLQDLHTARRDKIRQLQSRLDSSQCIRKPHDVSWLWAEVTDPRLLAAEAPADAGGRSRTAWARDTHAELLEAGLADIGAALTPGVALAVEREGGELRFLVGGAPRITHYEQEDEAKFLAAQWRQIARMTNVTGKYQAKTLVKALLNVRDTNSEAIRSQVVGLDSEILALDDQIIQSEHEMNYYVYGLYGLSKQEIRLVEA